MCTEEEYRQLKKAFFEKEQNLNLQRITLRAYHQDDAAVIAGWLRTQNELYQWSADRYNKFPISGDDINANYAPVLGSGRFIPLTAVEGHGDVIGHLIIRYPQENDDTSVRFGFVIVDPALRGRGLGKELLRLAIEYVKAHLSATRIDLGVFDNNGNASHCYEAAGFKPYAASEFQMPIGTWKCTEMELFIERT